MWQAGQIKRVGKAICLRLPSFQAKAFAHQIKVKHQAKTRGQAKVTGDTRQRNLSLFAQSFRRDYANRRGKVWAKILSERLSKQSQMALPSLVFPFSLPSLQVYFAQSRLKNQANRDKFICLVSQYPLPSLLSLPSLLLLFAKPPSLLCLVSHFL